MTKFKLITHSNKGRPGGFRRMAAVFMAIVAVLSSTAITNGSVRAYPAFPDDMNRVKYNSAAACVGSTLRSDMYPVGAIAQQWNVATDGEFPLTYKSVCSPYEPSMTVGVFNNPNYGACLAFTNTATFPSGESNFSYWQHGLGIYLNVGIPGCVSTAQRRSHQIAAGIGYALGLNIMTTSGYASRVMCTCSLDTVRSPDPTSAYRVKQIYTGYYGW